jgi:hypothetical protein
MIPRPRMNNHSLGLVNNDDMRIFVEYPKGKILGQEFRAG